MIRCCAEASDGDSPNTNAELRKRAPPSPRHAGRAPFQQHKVYRVYLKPQTVHLPEHVHIR